MGRVADLRRLSMARAATPDFVYLPMTDGAGANLSFLARVSDESLAGSLAAVGTATNAWDNARLFTPAGDGGIVLAETTGALNMLHMDRFFDLRAAAANDQGYLVLGLVRVTSGTATEAFFEYSNATAVEGLRVHMAGGGLRLGIRDAGTAIVTTNGTTLTSNTLQRFAYWLDLPGGASRGYANGTLGETDDISALAPYMDPADRPADFTCSLLAGQDTGPALTEKLGATLVGVRMGPLFIIKLNAATPAAAVTRAIAQHNLSPYQFPAALFA